MKRRHARYAVVGLSILLAFLMGLGGGLWLHWPSRFQEKASVRDRPKVASQPELIREASDIIQREYVGRESIDAESLTYGAMNGLVGSLGDGNDARWLSPEAAQRQRTHRRAKFAGIGAYIEIRDGRPVIIAPIDDSPAERAGLEPGDIILEVDGEDVTGLRLDEVQGRVMGPVGIPVTIKARDPDTGNALVATLERAEVKVDLVSWYRVPNSSTAHLRISALSEGASADLKASLKEIRKEPIKGLILDLRNNTGGLVEEAVGVTSQFIDVGNVLLKKDGRGEIRPAPVKEANEAMDTPMVVLVNGGTGSAAEIVAGALQDHERAIVVGTSTLGAGTVLNEFELSDGSLLILPVEAWLTPDGRTIWPQGLAPDIDVGLPASTEPLVRFQEKGFTAEQLQDSGDAQLLYALDLLSTYRHRASVATIN